MQQDTSRYPNTITNISKLLKQHTHLSFLGRIFWWLGCIERRIHLINSCMLGFYYLSQVLLGTKTLRTRFLKRKFCNQQYTEDWMYQTLFSLSGIFISSDTIAARITVKIEGMKRQKNKHKWEEIHFRIICQCLTMRPEQYSNILNAKIEKKNTSKIPQ